MSAESEREEAGSTELDECVFACADALERAGVHPPETLLLLGTGVGLLPSRLSGGDSLALGRLPRAPAAWRYVLLHHGDFHGLPVWILEDDADARAAALRPWSGGFPCWLAAAAGAKTLVHASAGMALAEDAPPVGSLAFVSDHVNLSGSTPLLGLGETRLGPLFPDQSLLHDERLRRAALEQARRLGLRGVEAVAACTAGPSLDTPAERAYYARTGCDVAVQGLATPLLAAAHAGLATLAVVVVADDGRGPCDLARIAATAQATAPALEDLLTALAPSLRHAAAPAGEA